jgi:dimethylamine/trimethylamine dehydrogenase
VLVGMRKPNDDLYRALIARPTDLEDAGIATVTRIGDCHAPGAIVHAVHSGHRYAREFESTPEDIPYARDFPV